MPKYTVESTVLWGSEVWVVYCDGYFYAGAFQSQKEALAFIERIAR